MSMFKLAYQNFKSSIKNYISLIVSLSFTILIFFNFQNIVDSDVLNPLSGSIMKNVEIIIRIITFVLVCFMIFFIWYSTNIFLAKRKREIGIYIFMGLSNQKIGKLYLIETTIIGLVALLFGITFGVISAQLFQMILFKLSNITIDLQMGFSLKSLFTVTLVYLVIYFVFALKGYINIVRSSVLEMVTATRQNEIIKQNNLVLIIKSIVGIIVLTFGYYLAIQKGGMETISNAMAATVLVIIGIYFLFSGCIPFLFQSLAKRKRLLYKKERILWLNNIIFRIRKNYRTYAMVSVLMLCSVTALATGVAMKNRHDGIIHFRNTYTLQALSNKDGLYDEFQNLIEKENTIENGSHISILQIDSSYIESRYTNSTTGILSYSQLKQLAMNMHIDFPFVQPDEREYVNINHKTLLNLITDNTKEKIKINGLEYSISDYTTNPYLGSLQEQTSYYMVNDDAYNQLKGIGTEIFIYNYKITQPENYAASVNDLQSNPDCMGLIKIDPNDDELQWIRILYSLCVFMFIVFILASGSIIFMKLYNDAFEEKERYLVLQKTGVSKRILKRSIANELRFAYIAPFVVMSISSYFSIHALANMMETSLLMINIISVVTIMIFFIICYLLSLPIYQKNVGIK